MTVSNATKTPNNIGQGIHGSPALWHLIFIDSFGAPVAKCGNRVAIGNTAQGEPTCSRCIKGCLGKKYFEFARKSRDAG